jgi:rhamnosyltransferase subunit B
MARIVIATFGSLGDLHPAIAVSLELQHRGHDVVLATSENYRAKAGALGLAFHALRPDLLAGGDHIIAEIMDGARGTQRLMQERVFPAIQATHDDLAAILPGADLLLANELMFAAPVLAATKGVRWVPYFLAPVSLLSCVDPTVLPMPTGFGWLPALGPRAFRFVKWAGRRASHNWWRPLRELRRAQGLSPDGGHPLFEGKFSAGLNLALFSPVLQLPQPDWPQGMEQTGFCFFDEVNPTVEAADALPPDVEAFLQAGPPPIVFTLGSAAVYIAGRFYEESARAAIQLERRALLLLGKNPPPTGLPASVFCRDYLPYRAIFPRAAAIVHQGGIGTTAQSLRAGRPMVAVPFAHDQFDNAARITRLGVGRTLRRENYRADRVAAALADLLADKAAASRSAAIAAKIAAESGTTAACDRLERELE